MAEVRPAPSVLLTDDEARQRECPLIRYCTNPAHVIGEGAAAIHEHAACRGSGCQGWRWGQGAVKRFFVTLHGTPEEEWSWNPTGSDRERYADAAVRVVTEPPRGFCGYAGIPA